MSALAERLKLRLKGTWIHRAVWFYRHPRPHLGTGEAGSADARNADYDWETARLMFRVLRRNSNCIDVGAHAGDILRLMTAISPLGRHYAFEPLPHLARGLAENFPQVTVLAAAVSDGSGEAEFLFVENDPGYSGLRRRVYDRPDPKLTPVRVQVVTLGEVIPRGEEIAFIKIDVEGGEFHVIKGGIETIRRCQPILLFEAGARSTGQYGVKPDEMYALVRETLGYELSSMERWWQREPPYSRAEFEQNWLGGPEYYFIATPKGDARRH